jgi:hypothetical protein
VCGADVESIKHTVLDCTVAKFFGEEVKLLTGVKVPLLHPITWASDLIISLKNAAVILCGSVVIVDDKK